MRGRPPGKAAEREIKILEALDALTPHMRGGLEIIHEPFAVNPTRTWRFGVRERGKKMIERTTDIWRIYDLQQPDTYAICITTNGTIKNDGRAVMGRGTAVQAVTRFPALARELGMAILRDGNGVRLLRPGLIAFPVKPISGISDGQNVVRSQRDRYIRGSTVPGWAMRASLPLIERSLRELTELQSKYQWRQVYLPRPGCGAGELTWEQVRPLCEGYEDWLVVVTNER